MAEVFEKLVSEYDFILVDSPPVLPVVDAVILNKLTSGLVMVTAADRTRKRDLAQALEILQTAEVKVSGFVLNKVRAKSEGYQEAYSYHSDHSATGSRSAARSKNRQHSSRRLSLRR